MRRDLVGDHLLYETMFQLLDETVAASGTLDREQRALILNLLRRLAADVTALTARVQTLEQANWP